MSCWQADNSTIAASVPLPQRCLGDLCFTGIEVAIVEDDLAPTNRKIWARPHPRRFPDSLSTKQEIWLQNRAVDDWHDMHKKSRPQLATLNADGCSLLNCFNPELFQFEDGSIVVNIKTDNLEEIAWAIRNGYWVQSSAVTERITTYWHNLRGRASVYLLFSITGAKQYCALAVMEGASNVTVSVTNWPKKGNLGTIPIRFIYVKNVPFTAFDGVHNRDLKYNKPVTNMWSGMMLEYSSGKETMKQYITHPHYSNILVFPAREGPCPTWPADVVDKFTFGTNIGDGTRSEILNKLEQLSELYGKITDENRASTTLRGEKVMDWDDRSKSSKTVVPKIIVTPGTGDLPSQPFSRETLQFSRMATEQRQPVRRTVPYYPPGLEPRFDTVARPAQARTTPVHLPGTINYPMPSMYESFSRFQEYARNTAYQEPWPVLHQDQYQQPYHGQRPTTAYGNLDSRLATYLPLSHFATQNTPSAFPSHPPLLHTTVHAGTTYYNAAPARGLSSLTNEAPVNIGMKTFDTTSIARSTAATPVLSSSRRERSPSFDSNDSFVPAHHVHAWKTARYKPEITHGSHKGQGKTISEVHISFDEQELALEECMSLLHAVSGEATEKELEYLRLLRARTVLSDRIHELEESMWHRRA